MKTTSFLLYLRRLTPLYLCSSHLQATKAKKIGQNAAFFHWPVFDTFFNTSSTLGVAPAFYYFFTFKNNHLPAVKRPASPSASALGLTGHYFPLPLPRHYCFITMLDFFFFFFFLSFSRPSLWHLLAEISGLLPQNPRHGDASLGIAARTDGLQQGFSSLRFVLVLVLLGSRRDERVRFWQDLASDYFKQ